MLAQIESFGDPLRDRFLMKQRANVIVHSFACSSGVAISGPVFFFFFFTVMSLRARERRDREWRGRGERRRARPVRQCAPLDGARRSLVAATPLMEMARWGSAR